MLELVPVTFAEAQAFVRKHHRHHDRPPPGHKFSVAVADESTNVRGVIMVGRPVARHLDDGWTLEVNRCCTDGVRNGCSMLYGAVARVAFGLGYRKIITYTDATEQGASLRAANWRVVAERPARNGWANNVRPQVDINPRQAKLLWENERA